MAPQHPPGTIAVTSADLTRYAKFCASLMRAHYQAPAGTQVMWKAGANIAANLNEIVSQMHGEWVWFQGDDHEFPPDLLPKLLDHQLDIVAPLCVRRSPPYPSVISRPGPDGKLEVVPLAECRGLMNVHAVGSAGLLVRRRVFEKLDPPWFQVGQIQADQLSEDLWFCKRASEAGFEVWVDADLLIGHMQTVTVWPLKAKDGSTAGVSIDLGNDIAVQMSIREEPRATTPEPVVASKLNLGCGAKRLPGYINVDRYVTTADVVADFRDLAYRDVDEIQMSHVLEHLPVHEVGPALRHVAGWLRSGGRLYAEVPDMEAIARIPTSDPRWRLYTYGCQSHPGEFHYGGYTGYQLEELLAAAGLKPAFHLSFRSQEHERLDMPCVGCWAAKP